MEDTRPIEDYELSPVDEVTLRIEDFSLGDRVRVREYYEGTENKISYEGTNEEYVNIYIAPCLKEDFYVVKLDCFDNNLCIKCSRTSYEEYKKQVERYKNNTTYLLPKSFWFTRQEVYRFYDKEEAKEKIKSLILEIDSCEAGDE